MKLYLGDCLDILPTLPSGSVDLVLCDLPYGTTQNAWDSVLPLVPLWREYWRLLRDGGAIVLSTMQPFTSTLVQSQMARFKYEWIWEKNKATGHLNAKKQPLRAHESILVFYDRQCVYNPQKTQGKPYAAHGGASALNNYGDFRAIREGSADGSRYPRSVIEFPVHNNDDPGETHPTQKPVPLFEYLIRTYTHEGAVVLDNTMGSGTTGVAAANTDRRFIGIEKEPPYFEIAQRRIADAYEAALLGTPQAA